MNKLEAGIAAVKYRLKNKMQITLGLTGKEHDAQFIDLCSQLETALPNLTVVKETNRENALPQIRLSNNLIYSALPLERALDPFLHALALVNNPVPDLPAALQEELARIDIPTRLTLYTAVHCPHCPGMVRTLVPLAASCDNILLTIIDGTLFPEEAAKDQVMSAPCLILNREIRWTGSVELTEVVSMIINQEPIHLGAKSLKTILEDGKASWIAAKMMEANTIFPAFLELLVHPTWSVRLGAMVVVEEMAQTAPNLAAQITEPLWAAFDKADTTVKGDILYALGEAGDKGIKKRIEKLAATLKDKDIKEAALDALAALESRS